jgi:hypothetical protein
VDRVIEAIGPEAYAAAHAHGTELGEREAAALVLNR